MSDTLALNYSHYSVKSVPVVSTVDLLSFRQKVESPGLSKRRLCAFDWPKRRFACLGLSSFWRNDHNRAEERTTGAERTGNVDCNHIYGRPFELILR